MSKFRFGALLLALSLLSVPFSSPARADGNLDNVNHIIIVMQENHSFDNYFGALGYVPAGPYHPSFFDCPKGDHRCVNGLTCLRDAAGALQCFNFNPDDDSSVVLSFHDTNYCTTSDLQHDWPGSHREANLFFPNDTLRFSPNDGFVIVNDQTEIPDNGVENPTDDKTMGYHTADEIPFYYSLAQTFAIDDAYHASVVGPTFPNRAYAAAATSFGHLTTAEIFPPVVNGKQVGYKPITGTIYDLLDQNGISWVDYFSDLPISGIFRPFLSEHLATRAAFLKAAADGTLPQVSFVDPSFAVDQPINGFVYETDEHPPFDIRAGEYAVSQIVNAVRNGPDWKDSIIFITYDEHGGFYDHVSPSRARQAGARTPDGINPGQCEDLSNPPASLKPGGGAQCTVSEQDAKTLCPNFTPTGPYPKNCATFDQLGFRVPFIAVSPFSKPSYVSHTVGDHTSLLALIETRFFTGNSTAGRGKSRRARPHLTLRDFNANDLEDMFDFDNSPSLNAEIGAAPAPSSTDPGCPTPPAVK